MTQHLPVLVVVVPLAAALVAPLAGMANARLARAWTLLALAATAGLALASLQHVLVHGATTYELGGWAPPWGIVYVIDPLSAGMASVVSVMAALVAVYSGPHLTPWPAPRVGVFSSLFMLLTAGLNGIVVTGDLFNLYVFLEISALSAYALLADGGNRAVVATFRYLLIGTIAATLYLLGIGYLYAVTGTLNMADMASHLPGVVESRAVYVAAALILVGLAIKTALFPMHGWLPDVYSYGPAPATAFVSSAMGKVSAYALIRIVYFIFDAQGPAGEALTLLGWVSAVAVMAGSIMAIAQQDIRRMLAYSSVGQMGYIALGLSLGNALALTGALLHMLNHSVMKGCLFLVAGGARWRAGAVRVADFAGMARLMPVSMAGFSIAALSMIGLPPAAGFFSKWYLLSGAVEARAWPFVVAVVASSLLSLVYFFRIIELAYLREPAPAGAGSRAIDEKAPELPWTMLGPIVVLAGSVLLLGVFNQTVVSRFVSTALPLWMR